MLEKIKDIIYDISDYLVTIIIIFFIVISIAFVMSRSYGLEFSKNDLLSLFNKESQELVKEPEVETPDFSFEDEEEEEEKEPSDEDLDDKDPEDADEDEDEEEKEASDSDSDYLLEIVSGDSSSTISLRLEEAGVIEDSSELANALVEQGLDTQIQLGDFTFGKNLTVNQVIEILFP